MKEKLILPKGWEIKKLGEIGKVSMCKRVFKEDTTPEGDIPFYKIGTFGKTPDAFISKERYNEFSSKFSFPKKGDILISASGTIGRRVRYDGEPAYFQDSNIVWIDNNEKLVLNDYLYIFYEICNWGASKGATILRLYNDNLKQIEIPFPKSIQEQQRIVSILDEAFAAIAKAKANAEQNLKNAKELFESYLQGVFEKKGDGWEERTLEEMADEKCTLSYGIVQPGEEFENGLPVIRPTDLTSRYIKVEGLKRIDPKLADGYKRTKLIGDELLLCVRGTTGVVSIATPELKDANVTRGIVPIRFNPKILNQEFGYYLLISNYVQKQIRAKTYGAALMQINIGDLRKILTPYPSLKEQQAIVRQLDALRAETQKLEAVYQKKIADLEELKKSILQKAFSGGLNLDFKDSQITKIKEKSSNQVNQV